MLFAIYCILTMLNSQLALYCKNHHIIKILQHKPLDKPESMTPATTYQPVSCAMHSELELAIMHGKHLCIRLKQPDSSTLSEIKPYDICCRKNSDKLNGEYLLATGQSGLDIEIRLDNIHSFQIL